jgi:hypothetical protein
LDHWRAGTINLRFVGWYLRSVSRVPVSRSLTTATLRILSNYNVNWFPASRNSNPDLNVAVTPHGLTTLLATTYCGWFSFCLRDEALSSPRINVIRGASIAGHLPVTPHLPLA